jgi:predicted NBD/HSP70 family sugar kinase
MNQHPLTAITPLNLRYNERRVLQVLRRMGNASKAEIARVANLTNAAVGSIATSLEKQNLLIAGKKRYEGQRGQPATMLHLNPTGAYGLGVRLERNGFQTVLIDFDGNILARFSNEMELPHPEKTLEMVCSDISAALATVPSDSLSHLTGIGLAHPYNLGSWLRELGLPEESFKKWDSFNFSARLEEKTGIPVHSENDGTAAAIAELFYGAGRERDDFLYLFFGPAIGGGLVLKGDIVRGNKGNAADVGLMAVLPSTLASAVPPRKKWDILLNRASLNSLRRHLRYCAPEVNVASRLQLELAVQAGGPFIDEWADDCIDALLPALISAKALLDVPALVIEANIGSGLVALLREKLEVSLARDMPESRYAPELLTGTFGCDAGAVGAASLPIFYNFSPRKPLP